MSRFTPGPMGSSAVTVTVRDGRSSVDQASADPTATLVRFEAATPFRVGDLLTLPDGSRWPVAEVRDQMTLSGAWSQIVTIGDAAP